MSATYDTLGTTITVRSVDTNVTVGFTTNVAIVGGMDMATGSATPGEAVEVASGAEAADEFGTDSELHKAVEMAYANGVNTVYGVAVPETSTTESFASTSSSTLANTPILDPTVQPEHDVTATDTVAASSVTVNIVYDNPPTTPSNADTINLNPRTGDWEADASSDYDISYDYGDYSSTVLSTAADQSVRFVIVLTEDDSIGTTLQSELESRATNFEFKRGVVGAHVGISPGNASSYADSLNDQRIVAVAPSRGTYDGQAVRTASAVGSLMAIQPLGLTSLYDAVSGLSDLRTKYTPTEATDFQYVTSLTESFEVAQAVTTSETAGFQDVQDVEVIDAVAEALKDVCDAFKGEPNFQEARRQFATNLRRTLRSFATERPPLLATGGGGKPYDVDVRLGASDDIVEVDVGIEVTPIAEQINLDIATGEVTTFQGADVTA